MIRNFDMSKSVSIPSLKQLRCGRVMENAERFRQYAAECRRLAKTAASKDRAALLEIANAWITVAEEAERKEKAADAK